LILLVGDLGNNDGVLKGGLGGQLPSLEGLLFARFIEHHVLGKLAGIRQVDNIAVRSETEGALITLAVVLESAASDPNIKALL
jgi:hypothetical protein